MSWTITPAYKGAAVSDPDAQTYLRAVETADGQPLEPAVARAVNEFVLGCKQDGIWSAIKASCILAGARTLAGALVPLVGAAPTNFNFVAGDYNRKTGLVGDGSTKYLNSNRNNNADSQNNQHIAVYVSSFVVSPGGYRGFIGGGDSQSGSSNIFVNGTTNSLDARSRSASVNTVSIGTGLTPGIVGLTRDTSASFVLRYNSASSTQTRASQTPANMDIWVFTANNNGSTAVPTASRFAFYSIGESLNLAQLDTRVTTLINAIAAAIP